MLKSLFTFIELQLAYIAVTVLTVAYFIDPYIS